MSKLIDLTGQRFGRLIVIEKDKTRITNSGSYWICQCDCGTIKSIKSSSLRRGEIQSCGCLRNERIKQSKNSISEENMVGKRFGKLTVISRNYEKGRPGITYWNCQCDCGNTKIVSGANLRRTDGQGTVSCGCLHRSIAVDIIQHILTDNNIPFLIEYRFSDLIHRPFDFALLDNNSNVVKLIEFDGEQHYFDIPSWGGLKLQQERDKIKNEYALTHNIPLIRIPYYEKNNLTLDLLLSDKYLVKDIH